MSVTSTPSVDNLSYLDGIRRVISVGLEAVGFKKLDTSDLTPLSDLAGYYNAP
jgi:hypothetical protein